MHVRVAPTLLLLVYAAALGVAVADLGSRALAGTVVLAGVLIRAALRRHHAAFRPAVSAAPATGPAATG